MLRAGIIAGRIDTTEQTFPGVWAAPLCVGTVAAAGGKLLVDLIQHLTGELKGARMPGKPAPWMGSRAYEQCSSRPDIDAGLCSTPGSDAPWLLRCHV